MVTCPVHEGEPRSTLGGGATDEHFDLALHSGNGVEIPTVVVVVMFNSAVLAPAL